MFAPLPDKRLTRPVYMIGPEPPKGTAPALDRRTAMYQCPRSAIPVNVIALYVLWQECRLMGVLPKPGAFWDQPFDVRQAFPVFELQQRSAERIQRGRQADHAAQSTALALVTSMFGGGGGRRPR